MSTRKGVPTAAIYVFINMLRKLRNDFAPQYFAAVFDVAAAPFRDEQYKAYKAKRRRCPGPGTAAPLHAARSRGISDSDSGGAGI